MTDFRYKCTGFIFFLRKKYGHVSKMLTQLLCVLSYIRDVIVNKQKQDAIFQKFYIFNSFIPVLLQLETPINYKTIYIYH